MKILLDTCSFLWIIWNDSELSSTAREHYINSGNDIYLSSTSVWEICIKWSLGKLPLPENPHKLVPEQRDLHNIQSLPLLEQAAVHITKLPNLHRDPFDRMLICQAQTEGMAILTPDHLIQQYPVMTIW